MENEYQSEERICLTCETPIRSAFFCSTSFIDSRTPDEKNPMPQHIGVCLLDRNCLRVYRNDGENFVTTIETPVNSLYPTYYIGNNIYDSSFPGIKYMVYEILHTI